MSRYGWSGNLFYIFEIVLVRTTAHPTYTRTLQVQVGCAVRTMLCWHKQILPQHRLQLVLIQGLVKDKMDHLLV